MLFISFLSYCNSDSIVLTADVNRIDTTGIHFEYVYLDSIYIGQFSLYITDEDFSDVDDIKLRVNKSNPEQYEFVSVLRKKWDTEEYIVNIKNSNEPSYYNYHDVDTKPIFSTATSEFKNDSAISQYFLQNSTVTEDKQIIGVYILIDENGKARVKQIMSKDTSKIELINELINKMPCFSSAVHKKDTVTVSYLIEIPVFN